MRAERSKFRNRAGVVSWSLIAICSVLGLFSLGAAVWRALSDVQGATDNASAAMYSLIDNENVLETEIIAAVLPAKKRTEMLAAEPDVIESLRTGDRETQTRLLNVKIKSATEIDAVALFDAGGAITAINTCYANGQPIAADRVKRVLDANYGE